jgi:hypothetical protein
MPQIWMTYREIADMLGSDTDVARAETIRRSLDRKKSRDGSTRAKLDLELTALFIATIRDADPALDQAIRSLRVMGDAMSRSRRHGVSKTIADTFDVAAASSQ